MLSAVSPVQEDGPTYTSFRGESDSQGRRTEGGRGGRGVSVGGLGVGLELVSHGRRVLVWEDEETRVGGGDGGTL